VQTETAKAAARTDKGLHRDPRLERPWFVCGQNSPDFGHVWASEGLNATALYFDVRRNIHACTEDGILAEGSVVEIHGYDFIVTWAPEQRVAA
jgi:hypothetical protein